MIDLRENVALITGASRGIGGAIARRLAENGVSLAISARSREALDAAADELGKLGIQTLACPADLADPAQAAGIVQKAAAHFGRLDIVINNAGIALPRPLEQTPDKEWDLHIAINARAPFIICREAIPHLRKSRAASIINISSVVGAKGYFHQGAYTASKHALMGMTKVLAQELHEDGIRVHAISPGGVATDMVASTRPDIDPATLIAPGEIADIVLFLLTHRNNAVIDEIAVHRAANQPWK